TVSPPPAPAHLSTPHKRHWFRWSLRTMFVVVAALCAFLGWLAWEWQFVRDRRAFNAQARADGNGYALTYPGSIAANWPQALRGPALISDGTVRSVPIWRRWLGDEAFGLVVVPAAWSKSDAMKVKSLFPESSVFWNGECLLP